MALPKYVEDNAGQLTEKAAVSVGGTAEAVVSTGTDGLLDASLMPTGIAPDVVNVISFENLAAGDFISLFNDGGTIKARKADASDASKKADGFVLAAVTSPATADVFLEGRNTAQSGMTIGAVQYLSAVSAGGVTETAPTTANNIVQILGRAISATLMTTENLSGITIKKA